MGWVCFLQVVCHEVCGKQASSTLVRSTVNPTEPTRSDRKRLIHFAHISRTLIDVTSGIQQQGITVHITETRRHHQR